MLKREVLSRCVVFVFCACFVGAAASALPGGVRAEAMADSEFAGLCEEGTAEQVQKALKDGANPNAADTEGGLTVLARAALNGKMSVVRLLLDAGADVNGRVDDGQTALMMAVAEPHTRLDVLKALLAAGADVNIRAADMTALLHASYREPGGEPEGELTAEEKRRMEARIGRDRRDWIEAVRLLLAAGAEVNVRNYNGMTPLMQAIGAESPEIVAMLLRAGADKSIEDNEGRDALRHARQSGNKEIIRLLQGGGKKKPAAKRR